MNYNRNVVLLYHAIKDIYFYQGPKGETGRASEKGNKGERGPEGLRGSPGSPGLDGKCFDEYTGNGKLTKSVNRTSWRKGRSRLARIWASWTNWSQGR
jgi:hypothetical protein